MRNIKKIAIVLITVLMLMSGCTKKEQSVSETATGFGGDVVVTLTINDKNEVVNVEIKGEGETPAIGGKAIETLTQKIKDSKSIDVDAVGCATFTSNAVLSAARKAYNSLLGIDEVEVVMTPGTYHGEAQGFRAAWNIGVDVTVDENSILEVKIDEDSADTVGIFDSVVELLPSRIVEQQSVSVDAICGATVTSNAVKSAVRNALLEALEDDSAISAFEKQSVKSNEVVTIDTGVLVVGTGAAGITASLKAAETMYAADPDSVSVLAIDKAGRYGGASSLCAGVFALNPENIQERDNEGNNYADRDALLADWVDYTLGDAKQEMIELLLDNSGDTLDWLVDSYGLELEKASTGLTSADSNVVLFSYAPAAKGMTVRREHNIMFYDRCMEAFTKMGGKYQLETEAYELIVNDGKVCGVKARSTVDGTEYIINADEVILCTGGFLANSEMTTKYLSNEYYPLSGSWDIVGMKQNDGIMIENAIENGAGTYNIEMCPAVHIIGSAGYLTTFEYHTIEDKLCMQTMKPTRWTEGDLPHYMGVAVDSLAVDTTGKRICNEENLNFDSWKSGTNFYSIYSEDQLKAIEERGLRSTPKYMMTVNLGACGWAPDGTPITNAHEVMDAAIEAGFVFKADSLEELAQLTGMDRETLSATVAKYNEACANGIDDEFGKSEANLDPVSGEGPYYAIKMSNIPYSTCGALDVNENLEVLDVDGNVIEGLYAAGLDASGVLYSEKKPYVTYGGVDQGFAFTSGRIAGEDAANKVLGK